MYKLLSDLSLYLLLLNIKFSVFATAFAILMEEECFCCSDVRMVLL